MNKEMIKILLFSVGILICKCSSINGLCENNDRSCEDTMKYDPTWDSLDKRPLPSWYDQSKVGIFLHWGVFSVPSFGSEWFWWDWQGAKSKNFVDFVQNNYRPGWTYADFAADFTAEFFDPDQWADIFKASGAKYIVLTSKHHEGFTNWPSKHSFNWNAKDVGPGRDLVGDLANSIRKNTDIHFGLYHSLFEWFHPLYLQDKANGFKTQDFVMEKTMPELYEIVNAYKPDVIWSDGDWETSDIYWNSTHFLAWLYNESPVKDTVVTNDRWGSGMSCHHGGYYTCSDRYNPGKLQSHKWENAMTIDKSSWGFRREAKLSDYMTMDELISQLVSTVSCGGNILVNVGPTKDGRIVPIFEERLRQMGQWLDVNGNAIYASMPWKYQNDTVTPDIWYTAKKEVSGSTTVFAITLKWPSDVLTLGAVNPSTMAKVQLLGYTGGDQIAWKKAATGGMQINIPAIPFNKMPCQWAWVFQLDGVSPM